VNNNISESSSESQSSVSELMEIATPAQSTITGNSAEPQSSVSELPEKQTEIATQEQATISESSSELQSSTSELTVQQSEMASEEENVQIYITVGNEILTATPEDNSSAEAFVALLQEHPITVNMSDYAGMEKVGSLGLSLPRNDTQLNVGAGDVILYQGNQITIYYGTNSWSFTKLATIPNITGDELLKILGTGDVTVTFSVSK
jgi:hypothetical protein